MVAGRAAEHRCAPEQKAAVTELAAALVLCGPSDKLVSSFPQPACGQSVQNRRSSDLLESKAGKDCLPHEEVQCTAVSPSKKALPHVASTRGGGMLHVGTSP